ncbi:MAG: FAD-dependent monooxygenase [Caldilineaceae bacterium]
MQYEVIAIGGGIAGSTLAKTLAEHKVRTLLLEREEQFRDRVRGEGMWPWGVAEAQRLGIYDLLRSACGHEVHWWNNYSGASRSVIRRHLPATSSHGVGSLTFYHPEMQQVLLTAAQQAGVEVWRGARAVRVTPGAPATVTVQHQGKLVSVSARLVVCADGRNSQARLSAGFPVQREAARLAIAGLLFENLAAPTDEISMFVNPRRPGQFAIFFPLGRQRHRVYFAFSLQDRTRQLCGAQNIPRFISECLQSGVPTEWFAGGTPAGPLAMFQVAGAWVNEPCRPGVALVGDAAAASNPSFGCGLSLTLRDVRVLSQELLATSHWSEATLAYARQHDHYYANLRRKEGWLTDLFFALGPTANQRRAHVMPLHRQEPERDVDIVGIGPDDRHDELARVRFFGEDLLPAYLL